MAIKPFFVPQKEIDLFDALNEELIDEVNLSLVISNDKYSGE